MAALRDVIIAMPGYVDASDPTDADVLAYLNESVSIARRVAASEVLNYLSTQIDGSGVSQRSTLDLIREFAEAGTVRSGAPAGNATDARRSGARMVLELLRHGRESVFQVDNANVRAQFIALGPDGGNGVGILSSAQLAAIDALATQAVPRWQSEGIGFVPNIGDVQIARAA